MKSLYLQARVSASAKLFLNIEMGTLTIFPFSNLSKSMGFYLRIVGLNKKILGAPIVQNWFEELKQRVPTAK
jgi:hypothetical protein